VQLYIRKTTHPEPLTLRKRGRHALPVAKAGSAVVERLLYINKEYNINYFPVYGIDLETRECLCGSSSCSAPGKHPIHKGWNKKSFCPKEILYSANNIGIATGQITKKNKYLVIIDFDDDNQEIKQKLPKTIVTQTGRNGGEHYWFLSTKKIPNSVGTLAPKVDVRGYGGLVVGPGSMHKTGKTYTFKNDCGETIADLPEWIEEELLKPVIKKPYKKPNKLTEEFKNTISLEDAKNYLKSGVIPKGVRNNVVYRLTLAQRANGLTRTELLNYAKTIREKYCEEPETLYDSELKAIVYNIMKHCKVPFFVNTNIDWFYKRITSKNIVEVDKSFFKKAFVEDENGTMTFKEIIELRNFWHKIYNTTAFVMKGSLVGTILNLNGFVKKHTYKGNVWKIKLAPEFKKIYDEHCKEKNMAQKEFEVKVLVHPNEKKYVSGGSYEKQEKIIENIDKEIETEPKLVKKLVSFMKNEIHVGDVVGFDENVWEVSKHDSNLIPSVQELICLNRTRKGLERTKQEKKIKPTIIDFFEQYKIDYFEILYRNGEVFNTEKTKKVKLSLPDLPEETNEPDSTKMLNMSSLTTNFFTNFPVELAIPKQVKTVFVSDFFVSDVAGGAEMTMDALLLATPEPLNVFHAHSSTITVEFLRKYKEKHFVFGNFTNISSVDVFNELETKKYNYSIIEFDFKGCAYRSFVKHLQEARVPCDCNVKEHGKRIGKFYENAKRIFWMSAKQRDIALEHLKLNLPIETHGIVLSSVFKFSDLKNFERIRNSSTKKNVSCILPDDSSWIKGIQQTKAMCEVRGIPFESLPKLPYQSFLEEMAKYKQFIFMPTDYDTCPRTVIEAKLLGCEVMLNKKVLHSGEEWFSGGVEQAEKYLSGRAEFFWSYFRSE
jgi:hypothetical protein